MYFRLRGYFQRWVLYCTILVNFYLQLLLSFVRKLIIFFGIFWYFSKILKKFRKSWKKFKNLGFFRESWIFSQVHRYFSNFSAVFQYLSYIFNTFLIYPNDFEVFSFFHNYFQFFFIPFSFVLWIRTFAVIQNQEISVPPMIPYCSGRLELSNCSNECARPSCIQKLQGPTLCPYDCQKICVCKGDWLYNDCSEDCVKLEFCPPLDVLLACKAANNGNWWIHFADW